MSEHGRLRAEIITTGTEILLGEIVDTNAAWIAQQLRDTGVNLYYKTTVGDNAARLCEILHAGLERSDVLIVTGGLGPTADDITRDAIARATACPLQLQDEALETLKGRFARFGVEMTENNIRQAYIPEGATLIENPVGTAPGFIVESPAGTIIAVPGVPSEMKQLMTRTVLPYLRQRNGETGVILRRVLRTIGIGESAVDHRLADLMDTANPTIGLAAHIGQVDVRITANATDESAAATLLEPLEATIRQRLDRYIYSQEPKQSIADEVAVLLQDRNARVAIVERATDNGVRAALSEHDVVGAGWDLHALPAAWEFSALPIDDTTVRALAERARQAGSVQFGLSVLGTKGADGGVFGANPGETYIAVAHEDGIESLRISYAGEDANSTVRIRKLALAALWRVLSGRAD